MASGPGPAQSPIPWTTATPWWSLTSGSTGKPKGVVLTHAAIAAHARGVHERLAVDPARDRWLACLPLAHMGGLGVVLRALVDGVGLDVVGSPDPATVASAPAELGSTLTSLVPTALDRTDASAYRWIVLGGAADPVERPANVVRTYGLTESGGGVVYWPGGPLPGVEVRVVRRRGAAARAHAASLLPGRHRPATAPTGGSPPATSASCAPTGSWCGAGATR